jgi:hypothetical protein
MEDSPAKGEFQVKGFPPGAQDPAVVAEVIGEGRKIDAPGGKFSDDFKGLEVHIYKFAGGKK